MANETKNKLTTWVLFAVSCLSALAKVVVEIINSVPTKGE